MASIKMTLCEASCNLYNLIDRVNQLRTSHGLQKVPHVQQEVDAQMARILEERRTNWQQQGTSPAVSSSNHSSGTRSRRRGGGRG